MDNVNYNFEIVELLYEAKRQQHDDARFNKPIIILLVAIIECILYDFIERLKQRTIDPINVRNQIIDFFKNASGVDELKKIIQRIESQNLLHVAKGDSLYKDLDYLRKVRNRLHIQNKYNELDCGKENDKYKDEANVFTHSALQKAQHCLEYIIDFCCNHNPRWNKVALPMSEFPRPWDVN
ncbi:MAG: hypothetical protein EHM58_15285 [Ignavibacteriae bacterium]|nr:MAG: hypothetical protein EHM58_15285 [Ignavibacteriota bacterium]